VFTQELCIFKWLSVYTNTLLETIIAGLPMLLALALALLAAIFACRELFAGRATAATASDLLTYDSFSSSLLTVTVTMLLSDDWPVLVIKSLFSIYNMSAVVLHATGAVLI
jgi:hypothetical protein